MDVNTTRRSLLTGTAAAGAALLDIASGINGRCGTSVR